MEPVLPADFPVLDAVKYPLPKPVKPFRSFTQRSGGPLREWQAMSDQCAELWELCATSREMSLESVVQCT